MITKIFYISMGLILLSATIGVIFLVIATFSALGILPGIFTAMLLGGMASAGWALWIEMFLFEMG